ncbi:MAG: aminotransferase class I/II-fold pyridoxal phosphate-dependent enzyme [Bacteroidota bacterium]
MTQNKQDLRVSQIEEIARKAKTLKVAHLNADDQSFNGRYLMLNGKKTINFASCNYLGLALDERVIEGAKEGAERYGTSFPTSRSFIQMSYLDELEQVLEELFGYPCLVSTTTSLGHVGWLPLLVGDKDAVLLDHQVHNSVATAAQLLKAKGCPLETIRHNNLEKLEERVIALSDHHEHIWYLADGIYSMYGDRAPVKGLVELLEKHPKLHVYFDDAHGMSWTGERGVGHVLGEAALHPRMALITSLGKSFGSLGGAMILHSEEEKNYVKACAGPLIFSSPLPASVIGASLASASIHLSNELPELQGQLNDKINYFKTIAGQLNLPIIGEANTPIFFIPVGNPDSAFSIGRKLMDQGFYQSLSVFPSVPIQNAGLRYTITNWIEKEDIEQVLERLHIERKSTFEAMLLSEEKVLRAFKGVRFTQSQVEMVG